MHSDDVDNFVEVAGLRPKTVHAKCLTTPTCSSRMHIFGQYILKPPQPPPPPPPPPTLPTP